MNGLLWTLQILGALLYTASGVMKVFMFDKVSGDVPSFGALPKRGWSMLGTLELACVVLLIVPSVMHWHPRLSALGAAILAAESLVFVGVHVKYREVPPVVMSALLGMAMAFVAYGRTVLLPLP